MPAPASVVAFVAGARGRRNMLSGLESLALGIAAACMALAACRFGPDAALAPGTSALAACGTLCGLAMAGTWWVERAKKTDLELARQIDARLQQGGALATAYEVSLHGEVNALADLLEKRVVAGLGRTSLRRALPALGFIWFAPPAIGAALLALAFELPAPRSAQSQAAESGTAASAAADPRALARARSALDRARQMSFSARNDPRLRAQLIGELAAAARGLDAAGLAPSAPGIAANASPSLLEELAAESAALASDGSVASSDPSTRPAGAHGESQDPAAPGGPGSGAEGGKSLLTAGPPERTRSGSNRPTAAPNGARPANQVPEAGAPGEQGTLAGRWWDERSDPVVQGWRRALAARAEQH